VILYNTRYLRQQVPRDAIYLVLYGIQGKVFWDSMILRNARYFSNENTLHGKVFKIAERGRTKWPPALRRYLELQIPRFAKYIRHLLLQVIDTLRAEVLGLFNDLALKVFLCSD
jgi:hypothetical protein